MVILDHDIEGIKSRISLNIKDYEEDIAKVKKKLEPIRNELVAEEWRMITPYSIF